MDELKKAEFHLFEVDGHKYLFDVTRSLSMEIDDVTYEVLDWVDRVSYDELIKQLERNHPRESIVESIEELHKTGILFSNGRHQPTLKLDIPSATQIPINVMDFNISHDCNFRCRYCYGGGGNYGGERKLMSMEVATKAIEFFLEHSGNHKRCEVIFFGGEPLMNMKVLKHVVDHGRKIFAAKEKELRFGLTTNGSFLTDKNIAYLNENKIRVTISLDGSREVHNKMRYFGNKMGTYDFIVPKIKKFLESRNGRVSVRATATRYSVDIVDTAKHLFDVGFDNVIISPVTTLPSEEYSLTKDDYETLKTKYKELAHIFIKDLKNRKNAGLSFYNELLYKVHNATRRIYGCGGGRNYLMVDPDGDLYVCHRCAGMPELKLGDIFNGIDPEKQRQLLTNYVDNRKNCSGCWARYLCGGGCLYASNLHYKDITVANDEICELFRRQMELAIWIYSQIHEQEKEFIEEMCERNDRPYMRAEVSNQMHVDTNTTEKVGKEVII